MLIACQQMYHMFYKSIQWNHSAVLVGGVLVERKVGEVEPALIGNKDKLSKLIETLEKQLTEKGGEINGYIEKHNIQIQGSKSGSSGSEPAQSDTKPSSGVLVSSGTEESK